MSHPAKFLKISYRNWWFIFLALHALLFALMIGSLGAKKWVYTDMDKGVQTTNREWDDSDNNVFYGHKFEGSLFECTESCDETWGKLAKEWCDYYDDVKDKADDSDDLFEQLSYKVLEDPARSVCVLYAVLFYGSGVYTAFEILALVSLLSWTIGMLMYWNKVKCCLVCSMVCSGCVWFGHYVAFIFFMVFTRTNYLGDCDEMEDDGINPKLCASSGPALGLFIAIIIPLIVVAYCIVGCNLKKKHGPDGLRKHHLESPQNHGNFDQSQYGKAALPTHPATHPATYPAVYPASYGAPSQAAYPSPYPANPSYQGYPANPTYPTNSAYPQGEYKA